MFSKVLISQLTVHVVKAIYTFEVEYTTPEDGLFVLKYSISSKQASIFSSASLSLLTVDMMFAREGSTYFLVERKQHLDEHIYMYSI